MDQRKRRAKRSRTVPRQRQTDGQINWRQEQLRIVHEIASLLGETAADTKVAIEELKQTILQEIK